MWQPKEKFEGRLQEFVLRIPKNLAQAVAYHQPLPIQAHLGNSHAHLFYWGPKRLKAFFLFAGSGHCRVGTFWHARHYLLALNC
jgi:hypothetical protein